MNRHVVDKPHKCNNKLVKNKKGWPGTSVRWLLRWYWWRFWQWWRKPKTYFLITNSWFWTKISWQQETYLHADVSRPHWPTECVLTALDFMCFPFLRVLARKCCAQQCRVCLCAFDTLKTLVRVFDDWSCFFCRNTKKTNPIANWGCSWCGVNLWFRIAQQQNPQTCNVVTHQLNDIWSLFLQNSNQLGICS